MRETLRRIAAHWLARIECFFTEHSYVYDMCTRCKKVRLD